MGLDKLGDVFGSGGGLDDGLDVHGNGVVKILSGTRRAMALGMSLFLLF